MRRFTSGGIGGGATGGAGGVRCDCTSRLPRATKIPSMLGIMSRT